MITRDEAVALIERLLETKERVIVALDGMSCSGKTTFAAQLAQKFSGSVVHMDDFFLPADRFTEQMQALPGGNMDRARFQAEVLSPLAAGADFSYAPFSCKEQALLSDKTQVTGRLIVVEGAYALDIRDLRGNVDTRLAKVRDGRYDGAILAMAVTLAGIGITILGRGDGHRLSLKLPLNGVLFAIGAAICQGVGLVLSKIGMNQYEASMTATTPSWLLPFFANFYRCIAGIVGFAILMYFKETFAPLRRSVGDRKGMTAAVATTIFGPFVGVGCSLMAVQYTAAGIASTLMALTPIIIILPAWWLFRQPITFKSVIGAIISVIGVSLFFLL